MKNNQPQFFKVRDKNGIEVYIGDFIAWAPYRGTVCFGEVLEFSPKGCPKVQNWAVDYGGDKYKPFGHTLVRSEGFVKIPPLNR